MNEGQQAAAVSQRGDPDPDQRRSGALCRRLDSEPAPSAADRALLREQHAVGRIPVQIYGGRSVLLAMVTTANRHYTWSAT